MDIVVAGDATRLTQSFEPLTRTYTGTIVLGSATATYDGVGEPMEELPDSVISNHILAVYLLLAPKIPQ